MKTVLLASAAVFALTGAAVAGAAHPNAGVTGHFAKHVVYGVAPGSVTLYDQNNNDSGAGNTSQNFETSFDQYDNQGADDFVVPAGHKWTIKEVDVTGQYRYSGGSAATASVAFYKDKGGKPGKQVGSTCTVNTNDSGATGDFQLKLGKDCPVKLKAGTYWVSVAADLDFSANPAKQWYWDTSTSAPGAAAAWQDPNGGWTNLGIPADCVTWQTLNHCLAGSGGWMFALKGKDKS